jgi:hypothetical protein
MSNTKKQDEIELLESYLYTTLGLPRGDEHLERLVNMIDASHADASGVLAVRSLVQTVLKRQMALVQEAVTRAAGPG